MNDLLTFRYQCQKDHFEWIKNGWKAKKTVHVI